MSQGAASYSSHPTSPVTSTRDEGTPQVGKMTTSVDEAGNEAASEMGTSGKCSRMFEHSKRKKGRTIFEMCFSISIVILFSIAVADEVSGKSKGKKQTAALKLAPIYSDPGIEEEVAGLDVDERTRVL